MKFFKLVFLLFSFGSFGVALGATSPTDDCSALLLERLRISVPPSIEVSKEAVRQLERFGSPVEVQLESGAKYLGKFSIDKDLAAEFERYGLINFKVLVENSVSELGLLLSSIKSIRPLDSFLPIPIQRSIYLGQVIQINLTDGKSMIGKAVSGVTGIVGKIDDIEIEFRETKNNRGSSFEGPVKLADVREVFLIE